MAEEPRRRRTVREPRPVYQAPARGPSKTKAIRNWEWVQANRSQLEEQYAGRWIAVADGRVVGTGRKLSTVMKQAARAGVTEPFVTAFRPARYRGLPEVPL